MATASLWYSAPDLALDGLPATRWTSGEPQTIGDWFELKLLAPTRLDSITLATAVASDTSTAIRLTLDGSDVASTATASDDGTEITINFTARFATVIRLTLTSAAPSWWSIDTLQVCEVTP